jgi:hypothetical protein
MGIGNFTMKKIQAIDVVRDEFGMFLHPDFNDPSWDESTTVEVMNKWFADNGGEIYYTFMDGDAPDEVTEAWFENDDYDCSKWEPKCDKEGAFLLSIHDTEGGPIAVFFVPKNQLN